MRERLDVAMVKRGLTRSRSQAESYIKLGEVKVNGRVVTKPGTGVMPEDKLELVAAEQFVSRAALKLASAADKLGIDFRGKTVLDVGSSTGGFTEYALSRDAAKVIAVELGRDQMHPSLRGEPRIELHEQTDIRDIKILSQPPDIVLTDVSFVSLREILPHVSGLCTPQTLIAAMVKPQFEAAAGAQGGTQGGTGDPITITGGSPDARRYKHKGVIKNDAMRRQILKDFETWARGAGFVILEKADSAVSGAKGNKERFYLLRKASRSAGQPRQKTQA